MRVTALADGQWGINRQILDPGLAAALSGQTVTISAWIMGQSAAPLMLSIGNVSTGYAVPMDGQPHHITATGVYDASVESSGVAADIFIAMQSAAGTKAGDWYIATGIKLELGAVATSYTPNPAWEYMLCSLYSPSTGEWIGRQHSNQNLLRNWYFGDPVNQRGQTKYTQKGYTIDGWKLQNDISSVTLNPAGYISLEISGPDAYWYTAIEPEYARQLGVATFSILLADSSTANGSARIVIFSSSGVAVDISGPAVASGVSSVTLDLSQYGDIRSIEFRVASAGAGKQCNPRAAKLELGSVQTLAHQDADGNWVLNDPPPDKAVELLKCQRYYWDCGVQLNLVGNVNNAGSVLVVTVPAPTQFRANPTITYDKSMTNIRLYDGTNIPASDITSIAVAEHEGNHINLFVTASGLKPRSTAMLLLYNAAFNANL